MRISELLSSSAVISELAGHDAVGVLRELGARATPAGLPPEAFFEGLRGREALGSTALGDGFGLPHARVEGLERLVASFGRTPRGVDFASPDGKPTFLFFALFSPTRPAGAHLKALARISQLFRQASLREALLTAPTSEAIHQLIVEADISMGVAP